MTKVLIWCYEKAINGLPGTPSAAELAESYLNDSTSPEDAIDSLIRWQVAKTSASGFITGLGGLMTLPVAIPADLAATMYINVRMVAAIAYIRGYDLKNDKTRTAVFLCLVGDSIGEVLAKVGVEFGGKYAKAQFARISGEILMQINKAVGFRLATKAGQRGIVNLSKIAPVFGGLIGGTVNGFTCRTIGKSAKNYLAA